MSADTGIYIAKFPDGYRVTEVVQAIENIDWHGRGTKARKKQLSSYFGNSPVFEKREDAEVYALEIYHKYENDECKFGIGCPIEYGISFKGNYEAFV